MKKVNKIYLVDVFLAISFILTSITGIMKLPVLANYSLKTTMILTKIHDISGIIMVVFVAIHLIQHWNWIVTMTKKVFCTTKR